MEGSPTEDEAQQTYSVQLRLRRVIHEDAYVSVLIDEKVVQLQKDGTSTIDFEKFVAEAIRISAAPEVDWQVEGIQTDAHPIQAVRPVDRDVVDSFYLPDEQ
ncbi:hypothetical protein GCM10022409_21860 [Hymenobacter glaciei]|uniref:Uncharacterized protein n=1 Tax=Hymenobacter glaciei TaxID=877209 RepID=A0ABP7U5U2_9BACT